MKFYSIKFFCNTKFFSSENFHVYGTHKLFIDLLTVYLCVNIVAIVDVDYPCSFGADYDVLGWFHELLKYKSDEQLWWNADKISLAIWHILSID